MSDFSVSLKNVSKYFHLNRIGVGETSSKLHTIKAIDDVSLNIENGKMIGIIGKNGSGKTTLLRMIAGILEPDEGTLKTKGKIGPLLQVGVGSQDEFTVSENIVLYGILLGFNKKWISDKVSEILEFAELSEYKNVKMKHLSSGMKLRVMFSTSMLMDPDILLVDEVISVGDISFRNKSLNSFISFKNRNKTIVLVSHNLSLVQQLCDEVYFLHNGKIMDYGSPNKVINAYQELFKEN